MRMETPGQDPCGADPCGPPRWQHALSVLSLLRAACRRVELLGGAAAAAESTELGIAAGGMALALRAMEAHGGSRGAVAVPARARLAAAVSRAFPSYTRCILTEI